MLKDIRVALRFLARKSSFTATALLTLAIGVGLNSGIFSVLDAVVLRSLPFPGSDRLVAVWQQDVKDRSPFVVSAANFLDLRESGAFADICAVEEFANRDVTLAEDRTPENVKGVRLSPGCFEVLRVLPARGRAFTPAEADPGSPPVVVLSYSLWVSRFGPIGM